MTWRREKKKRRNLMTHRIFRHSHKNVIYEAGCFATLFRPLSLRRNIEK